jgi:acetate kinase
MDILAINCGSSSLKFELFAVNPPNPPHRRAWGLVDRIGIGGSVTFHTDAGVKVSESVPVPDHEAATRASLQKLKGAGMLSDGLAGVVHRVVHGGERFSEPVRIDAAVMAELEELTELAPLHNGPAVAAIRTARSVLGPSVPMVAVFDTAFHCTLPPHAAEYAIPHELTSKHHIRRYGFHGLAHRWMAERYAELTRIPAEKTRLITLQLGNGCSATAVAGGRSIDTSMGFTPLEGLVMGTRSGDIDPSLVGFLAQHEGVDVAQVEDWLNRRSGLLGVSGISRDMRELLERAGQGHARAALAVEMFCYRVRKYIGAYLAALGGADAVIFGGGIGENAPLLRSRICSGMDWCGLALDEERNRAAIGQEALISRDGAAMQAYVLPVDESAILVRDALRCLVQ